MDSQSSVNRIELEVSQWRSREERFSKLFSFDLSSNMAILNEKLRFFERIAFKYKRTDSPDERLALEIIKRERRKMEKQLYPDVLGRLLRRLYVAIVREPDNIRKEIRRTEQNSQVLLAKVRDAGFGNISVEVSEKIKQGESQFFVNTSSYIYARDRIDHQLSFIKDQFGGYRFEGFRSVLSADENAINSREHSFPANGRDHINASEAYNLLAGRALQKEGRWIQFDTNDKDNDNNYRIKEFHLGYGYDLRQNLESLPFKKDFLKTKEGLELENSLRQGNRAEVAFHINGKVQQHFIQANPHFKTVTIYDEQHNKIILDGTTAQKSFTGVKQLRHQERKQSAGNLKNKGMRIT